MTAAVIFSCAVTYQEGAQTVGADSYDPNALDTNTAYFSKVRSHFNSFGMVLPEEQLRRFTATCYVSSVPPGAGVYIGTLFIGRTNAGDLYFMPGQYVVTFSFRGDQWTEILNFVDGRNPSLAVRKR